MARWSNEATGIKPQLASFLFCSLIAGSGELPSGLSRLDYSCTHIHSPIKSLSFLFLSTFSLTIPGLDSYLESCASGSSTNVVLSMLTISSLRWLSSIYFFQKLVPQLFHGLPLKHILLFSDWRLDGSSATSQWLESLSLTSSYPFFRKSEAIYSLSLQWKIFVKLSLGTHGSNGSELSIMFGSYSGISSGSVLLRMLSS